MFSKAKHNFVHGLGIFWKLKQGTTTKVSVTKKKKKKNLTSVSQYWTTYYNDAIHI